MPRGARKLALDMLYENDLAGASIDSLLARYASNPAFSMASKLVTGVASFRDELDGLIVAQSEQWDLERMSFIDRNLLRLALFEMLHCEDVPQAVAINEAVELAKIYSGEDSGSFVNGILGAIANHEERSA